MVSVSVASKLPASNVALRRGAPFAALTHSKSNARPGTRRSTPRRSTSAPEDLGGSAGEPFAPLPAFIIGADEAPKLTSRSDADELDEDAISERPSAAVPQLARKLANQRKAPNLLASPTGFEPFGTPVRFALVA